MNLSFALIHEIQGLVRAIQEESAPSRAGPIVVSGMLAEQLARELGAGAAPGAVVVGDSTRGVAAEVWVHVMAGEPTADDQARVASGDRSGVPVVLVQLWPQAQWTAAFPASCRASCRPLNDTSPTRQRMLRRQPDLSIAGVPTAPA